MIGNREGLLEFMRDEHAGQPHRIVELADQPRRGSQRDRIKTGKRLVVHHQLRVQRNGACQRHATRHAARDFAGHQVACTAQADGIELHQHDVAHHAIGQRRVLAQRERPHSRTRSGRRTRRRTGTACPCAGAQRTAAPGPSRRHPESRLRRKDAIRPSGPGSDRRSGAVWWSCRRLTHPSAPSPCRAESSTRCRRE